MVLVGSLSEPLDSCSDILAGHATAVLVQGSKVILGAGITLFSGKKEPSERLIVIRGHSNTVQAHETKVVLSYGNALLCGQPVPLDSLGIVLGYTNSIL